VTSKEIDERLTSIARNLDTLTKLHLDSDQEWREAQVANERRFEQIARTFADALDSIKRLERIAVAHEQRLDDIEGQ
jgi:hypothetical protein